MAIPRKNQSLQDWITQQWVILFGRQIDRKEHEWLLGPFGNTNGIGVKFIDQLAEKEQLTIDKKQKDKGLIRSINDLNLSGSDLEKLSDDVIDFYENTANYSFDLKVKWNPIFKFFGILLKILFSNRIEQLNVPIENIKDSKALKSEIIHLRDTKTGEVKRTIWLRTFITGEVVYSGVYETCKIPSAQTCIKAIFPLPNGSATVILIPSVGKNGELILESSGKRFGDSGFYFLLNDSRGNIWAKYIKSFEDKLVATSLDGRIAAVQTMTLWNLKVLKFEYNIEKLHTIE